MKKLMALCTVILLCSTSFGQPGMYDEVFNLNFVKTKDGGQWVFKGKDHSFSVTIIAKNIIPTESPNYLTADNAILQASLVALPKSQLDLSRLTIDQQKQALAGYVNYELDYFKNDLKINYKDLKKEWVTLDSKLWLVWSFDSRDFRSTEPVKSRPKFQIYASTVCFNQILDLNTPVMMDESFTHSKDIIVKLMETLKLKQ